MITFGPLVDDISISVSTTDASGCILNVTSSLTVLCSAVGGIGAFVWDDIDDDGILDWTDDNGDGIFDLGEQDEPAIADVIIILYSTGPDGIAGTADDEMIDTTSTDVNGVYNFDELAVYNPGPDGILGNADDIPIFYYVAFPTTTSVGSLTIVNASGTSADDAFDSDAALSSGFSPVFTLLDDVVFPNVGAGYSDIINSIELINFSIEGDCNNSVIMWSTASETNSDYFIIQRSIDGTHWINIAIVEATGTSSSINNYTYNDHYVASIETYYRIVEVELSGIESVSDIRIISSQCEMNTEIVHVYPNPVNDLLMVDISSASNSLIGVEIIDLVGRVLTTQIFAVIPGMNTVSINTEKLAMSMYLIGLQNSNRTNYLKFNKVN